MSEKKDISHEYNSIFDQNTVTEIEDVIEGKDYQQAIFGQDMSGAMNEVLYTRSQYIKDYSDIVNNYKKERNEQIKSIVMVSAVALVLGARSLPSSWAPPSLWLFARWYHFPYPPVLQSFFVQHVAGYHVLSDSLNL